jgi:hypothetical protein
MNVFSFLFGILFTYRVQLSRNILAVVRFAIVDRALPNVDRLSTRT